MSTHFSCEQVCVSRKYLVVTLLEVSEKEEGVMALQLYIMPMQKRSGYE